MANFIFRASFASDPNEDYEIDDAELDGKSEEERNEIIEQHLTQWIEEVAASEIEQSWEEK